MCMLSAYVGTFFIQPSVSYAAAATMALALCYAAGYYAAVT